VKLSELQQLPITNDISVILNSCGSHANCLQLQVTIDELPDGWHCSLMTWGKSSERSCQAPEEDQQQTVSGRGGGVAEAPVVVEWVQCDHCSKWRKVAEHINVDALPEVWLCEMNTWAPNQASCQVPEEQQ
jgi:CW-type Zinc Finger